MAQNFTQKLNLSMLQRTSNLTAEDAIRSNLKLVIKLSPPNQ